MGYERLTIDAIAARAGVGKQTIYRWWTTKGAVLAEAAAAGGVAPEPIALPETGDLGHDLRRWLHDWVAGITTPEGTGLILALTAAGSDDKAIADRQFEQFSGPHENAVRHRLDLARRAGQIRADADLGAIASTLIGSLLYRVLTRHAPPTTEDADRLVDLVLRGAAP